MRKIILAEFTGTFAMMFCGCGAIIVDHHFQTLSHPGVSAVWGLIITAMIFVLGDISGAHFNPVVTMAFWLSKRLEGKLVLPFMSAQLGGAFAAVLLLKFLFPLSEVLGETTPSGPVVQSFILEIILTIFLVLVILNVSSGSKEKGITAALAIGATIGLCAMVGGPVSGASMNPFRSLVPALVSGSFEHSWIYLLAPMAGSVIAVIFHLQFYKIK